MRDEIARQLVRVADAERGIGLRIALRELEVGRVAGMQAVHRLAGTHRVAVRMSDDARRSDFGHVLEQTVTLKPAQILVIDFDTATQTITLQ